MSTKAQNTDYGSSDEGISKATSAAQANTAALRASLLSEASQHETKVATCSEAVRLGFLRKVYGILSVQLLVTVVVCGLFMVVPPLRTLAINGSGVIFFISMIGTFVTLMGMYSNMDVYPRNLMLLGAFTVFESLLLAAVCVAYSEAGLGQLIVEALAITLAVFSGITLYCFVSKRDFSFMYGFLYAALLGLIGASLVNLVFSFWSSTNHVMDMLISWGGASLFSLFILADTSMIMHRLSPDDYIIAAITLYLDLVNLFLYILRILSEASRD